MFDLTIQIRNENAMERARNPNSNEQLIQTVERVKAIAKRDYVNPMIALQFLSRYSGNR